MMRMMRAPRPAGVDKVIVDLLLNIVDNTLLKVRCVVVEQSKTGRGFLHNFLVSSQLLILGRPSPMGQTIQTSVSHFGCLERRVELRSLAI
jgi:hypothetical protein